MDPSITRLPRLRTVYVDKVVFNSIMAEHFYSVKTALRVGIAQILAGLTSIGIGAYNTRNENHEAFIEFKPEGLPVWSGALVSLRIYYIIDQHFIQDLTELNRPFA